MALFRSNVLAAALGLAIFKVLPVNANLIISFDEVMGNTVLSYSGFVNTVAGDFQLTDSCVTTGPGTATVDSDTLEVCDGGGADVDDYTISGPGTLNIGTPSLTTTTISTNGIGLFFGAGAAFLSVTTGYSDDGSGTNTLSGSATFTGTFADNGIIGDGLVGTWRMVDPGGTDLSGPGSTISLFVNRAGGGSFGDPHLKTWNGKVYDYHGECDLVLASSKNFANGQGLDIHIRTTIREDWSYISAAALRIGEDILEVQSFGKHYWNGVENAPLPEKFGGFLLKHMKSNLKNRPERFLIYTGKGKIEMRVYNDFVAVYVKDPKEEAFGDTVGLMGDFKTSSWLLRDGESITQDPNVFGAEWQVRDDESQLFVEKGTVSYPETCRLPSKTAEVSRHRRLEESTVTLEMAEEACKDWLEDKEFCIEDVLLTGDTDVAVTGVGAF